MSPGTRWHILRILLHREIFQTFPSKVTPDISSKFITQLGLLVMVYRVTIRNMERVYWATTSGPCFSLSYLSLYMIILSGVTPWNDFIVHTVSGNHISLIIYILPLDRLINCVLEAL